MEENMQKVEETTKPKKTKKTQPKKKSKAELRKILKEAEVVVVNNFGTKIGYYDNGFELQLLAYGDSDVVEAEELRKMHVKKKAFFNNYWLLITEVFCEDDSVTLEDVYEYIGISKLYKDIANPNEDFFDELLMDSDFDDFKKIIDKMNKELIVQMFVRATNLYKEGKLRDSFKIMYIEEKVDREDYFRDIKLDK